MTKPKNLLCYWPILDYNTFTIISQLKYGPFFTFLRDNVKYICIKKVKSIEVKALTHKTSRIVGINANLSIHLNQALHDDLSNFAISQGILQSITQKDNQRK